MADEIVVRQFMNIRKGNLVHNPPQREFKATLNEEFGPSPGAIQATYDGTDVDLSVFTDPGWVDIYNQEPTVANDGVTVSWGVYDPQTNRYYPVGKLEPGQGTGLIHLDDLFGGEFYPSTGTGSLPGYEGRNRLRVKAKDGDTANVVVNVFER